MPGELRDETTAFRLRLLEREKELDALYQLAELFTRPILSVERLVAQTAEILRSAMQAPERAAVEIIAENYRVRAGRRGAAGETSRVERTYSLEKLVAVSVSYLAEDHTDRPESEAPPFEERERHLIESAAALLANVLEREEINQLLRESTKTLQRQTAELERKNIALREVLSQIESQKNEIRRQARAYIETFIQPYLHNLGTGGLSEHELAGLEQVRQALQGLFSAESQPMPPSLGALSPREIEICGLLRNGLTTKQISSFLHITEKTVERHRNTIRKKLGINGKKVNLTSHLRSLE